MNTVVITGVSKGLGRFIAISFIKSGWKVIGTGRSPRPSDLSRGIEYFKFDASNAQESIKFWQQIKFEKGNVCLVNNAGGYVGGALLNIKIEDFENQIKSNYLSAALMTRGIVGKVESARIINLISNNALVATANNSVYGAAKAASRHFFKSLQQEFPPEKYQITNLYPSNIDSTKTNPKQINPKDLADLIVELAEVKKSFYQRDITLFPVYS